VAELLPEERETHINMTGDNHDVWVVFTDDPYWIRKLDKVAQGKPVGNGKEYKLRADQVVIRSGKKQLSETHKAQLAIKMRSLRKSTVVP
jgi:hypothetical protein